MKTLFIFLVLACTLNAWSAVCDLSSNDARFAEINRQFDEGNMSGEDHYLLLREAGRQRLSAIEVCLGDQQSDGITQQELKETKVFLTENLAEKVLEFNRQIAFEISMDRIGMATELMMERDLENLRVANLIAMIDRLTKTK